ncbi:CopG family ribbon-helix-helix protein [Atlantibacter hermannii]|uniref:CopG family ribbon-helix-helix protein n=1 Tax=Atlantibacter hermannii TaxID=565 RepID=UPI0028A7A0ED|nr:CopG family transcriptional regulator [Atlantibacter hermannii]
MADNSRQTTTLRIAQDIKQRLKNIADDRKCSTHALMLEAIAEYVEREEKRSQFHKDAQAGWEAYQDTGLHITAEETITWLESWGAEQDKDAPECHK